MSNNRQNTTREIALEFFGKRQFDKALPLIVELIEDGEQDSDLYYMAGQCYRFLNKFDNAIVYLNKAVRCLVETNKDQDDHAYYTFLGLGIALQLAERYEESAQELAKAAEFKPPRWAACNSLGLTYKKMGKHSQALKSYQDALERYVNEVMDKLAAQTGEPLLTKTDAEGVKTGMLNVELMNEMPGALRSEPNYAILQNNIGGAYLALGDLNAAKESFEESINFLPRGFDYPPPYLGLEQITALRKDQ